LKEAQCARLDRAPQEERTSFDGVGKIRDNHFTNVTASGPIKDQPKSALGIMLTDEYDSALKKRAAQLTAVEQQLTF
jgi:hypothetical protein